MDSGDPRLVRILAHDRRIVVGGLALVCLASWLYILAGAGVEMGDAPSASGGSGMAMQVPWTPAHFGLMLAMWWVMMVAMMLPGAAPTILIFNGLNRASRKQGRATVPAWIFAAGYLAVWGGFSLVATAAQWGLEQLSLLSPMMWASSVYLGAALLIAAGVYQLTPLKHACLRRCRSPLHFLASRWRPGRGAAFRMGVEHGLFCLGCCWVLMTLLFYGGMMNLWWIGGLALYVLIEKLTPLGSEIGRYTGGLLIVWGGWVLIASSVG